MAAPFRVNWGGPFAGGAPPAGSGIATEVETIDVPAANSYRLQLENLADAIEGAAPQLLGREDALGQARAIEALYRSAGREIDL